MMDWSAFIVGVVVAMGAAAVVATSRHRTLSVTLTRASSPPPPRRPTATPQPSPGELEALRRELGLLRLIAGEANCLPRKHRSPRLEKLLTRWRPQARAARTAMFSLDKVR